MKKLQKLMQLHFDEMCKTNKLFRSSVSGRDIWYAYLGGFSPEHDPIFRDPESTSHNCNHCNNFMRRYGNIIALDDANNIITLFDIELSITSEYYQSFKALRELIKSAPIGSAFVETFNELNALPYEKCKKGDAIFTLGVAQNLKQYTKEEVEVFGKVNTKKIYEFNHFTLKLPRAFVDATGASVEQILGSIRESKEVFKRGMDEIPIDTLELVRDLISQGSLLNGDAHLSKLNVMIPLKQEYDSIPDNMKDAWCWVKSYGLSLARFKNELIGVLCTELAEGKEINAACMSWNKRVDPANYMKASAPITQKQIAEAQKFIEENGYTESFIRRFAHNDDIKVTEIKHINAGKGTIPSVSIFDNLKSTSTRHKRSEYDNLEEVSIEKFMKDVLPNATSVEALLQNKHEGNMVTLTTANNPDTKPIFKWDNNYSWTFKGNLAGKSEIKEAVKTQGGNVEGVLRFSMMWADGIDDSDLDAHCIEPGGNRIYFADRRSYRTEGHLDIDITQPQSHKSSGRKVVENIAYPRLNKMPSGKYEFLVNQFSERQSQGFTAEIEFDGQIYTYVYPKAIRNKMQVKVATVTKNSDGSFTIEHHLPETSVAKELYGITSEEFHKVNLICLSPNHWGTNAIGNKHYFFMLDGCRTDTPIRSFHNENLIAELNTHRKVIEVLADTTRITPNPKDKQLSGLGFNATVRDELIVKVSGSHKRMLKIKF